MDELLFPLWEGLDYAEEEEQYIDVFTCGSLESEVEMECLRDLLLITQKDLAPNFQLRFQDITRKHTEMNGDSYLVSRNSLQKINKKIALINTLSTHNELIQTPSDASQIWFLSPTIEINE